MKFDHVLVGVSDADDGQDALRLAEELAGAESELTLAHVQVVADKPAPDSGAARHVARRRKALEELAALRDRAELGAQVVAGEASSVRRGLHDLARTRHADVLVIGASRQDSLGREITGDDTREVLEDAPCAVAVAPAGYCDRPAGFGKIGVAHDDSPEGERVLTAARALAVEHHAELSDFRSDADGDAAEALARYAQSIDLLVVGSHKRGPVARLLERSTAQRLADEATCPLLVLGDASLSDAPVRESARSEAHRRPARAAKSIVVGVEGRPEDRDAAVLAAMLARPSGAELLLVAVDVAPRHLAERLTRTRGGPERSDPVTAMQELCEAVAPGARTVVEPGWSMPRALLRLVSLEHPVAVVVGSSTSAPDGYVRIDGHTRELLSQVECPAAVAPRCLADRPQPDLDVIGVGYDGGPEAAAALACAASLARAAGARLHIRGVVEDGPPRIGPTRGHRRFSPTIATEVVEPELARLRSEAERAASGTGVKADVEVTPGSPADVLLELSRSVDLLAIGSRTWGTTARLLLGGTGETVMHDARCPVLLVPGPLRTPDL